jgi:predicted DNA-binding transcriptional regulator AlpA
MPVPTTHRLLSTREAAEYCGLAASTLEKARVAGRGPAYLKTLSKVAYLPADLDAWLEACRRRSTSEASAAA